jgi:Ecdysteroid kinase-like family
LFIGHLQSCLAARGERGWHDASSHLANSELSSAAADEALKLPHDTLAATLHTTPTRSLQPSLSPAVGAELAADASPSLPSSSGASSSTLPRTRSPLINESKLSEAGSPLSAAATAPSPSSSLSFISAPEISDVYAIDWQWFGHGNCTIDVVAFICTTPRASVLAGADELIKTYYDALRKHLPSSVRYDFETFHHHFKVALLDFCTYCICAKWSTMTALNVELNARKQHDGLHLRSYRHMHFIVQRASQYANELIQKM